MYTETRAFSLKLEIPRRTKKHGKNYNELLQELKNCLSSK